MAALGGHLAPNGSIMDPFHLTGECGLAAGNSILDPQSSMLTAESRRPRAKCHRPWAFRAECHGHGPNAMAESQMPWPNAVVLGLRL